MDEIRRRWRIFYRFWCGGLAYWMFGSLHHWITRYGEGKHRWDYSESRCKRTCSRCGKHEWLMILNHPSVGEPASHWSRMNDDELRWL